MLLLIYKTSYGKVIKFETCRAFYYFIAASLINSIVQSTNVRFYLSYDFNNSLKFHFLRKKHYVRIHVMLPKNMLTTRSLSIILHGVISLPHKVI